MKPTREELEYVMTPREESEAYLRMSRTEARVAGFTTNDAGVWPAKARVYFDDPRLRITNLDGGFTVEAIDVPITVVGRDDDQFDPFGWDREFTAWKNSDDPYRSDEP